MQNSKISFNKYPVLMLCAICLPACGAEQTCEEVIISNIGLMNKNLPKQCSQFGNIAIGMSDQDVVGKIGIPDIAQVRSESYTQSWYLYPRGLKLSISKSPVKSNELIFGSLSVLYRNSRVASIESSNGELLGFGHATFALHRNFLELAHKLGLKYSVNRSRDYVRISALPISASIDEVSGDISDVSIAADVEALYASGTISLELHTNDQGLVDSFTIVPSKPDGISIGKLE
jgi:hypothetical protein